MRNLRIADKLEIRFDQDDLPLTATTFDVTTNDVICAFGPSPAKPVIELKRCKSSISPGDSGLTKITSWDAPCPLPDLDCDSILSLQYSHDSAEIYLVLAGGDLILVREKPLPDQERIEIVGSIDVGIHAAHWSWDTSLLAVITRAGSFVLMTKQLEPVAETILQERDLSLSKHVSVGWGKKETQFQGKRAKALKDPTMPEFVDEGKPSLHDHGKTTISWRGDGAYVAVNSVIASSRRLIRIYSAEGVLDSVSEPVDALEAALSWRPHGNIIAGVKRGSANLQVIFFERNGLRHGEFDLRLSEGEMSAFAKNVSLSWNNDSSILAVSMEDRVQLWTMSNYHYSLKQEYRLPGSAFSWHQSDPFKFCLHNENLLQSVFLNSCVDRGSLQIPFDYGLVAVIDGKILKLTPLRHANAPPPIAFAETKAEDNILSCAFSRTCQRFAFLTHKHLYLCNWEMRQAGNKENAGLRHTLNIRTSRKALTMFPHPTQIAIKNDDAVLLLDPATSLPDPQARCYQHTWVNTENSALTVHDVEIPLDTRELMVDSKQESTWFRTTTGIVASEPHQIKTFPAHSRTSIANVTASENHDAYAVSLNDEHELVVDGRVCADQVTSFAVTNDHIVLTTSNHLMKFIHLHENSVSLQVPADMPEIDERCRAVERGSQIITVIPSIYAVILQMPRGNLETVYPRILVLAGIRKHVRECNYREAFLACRTHQVDLNILYDYDPVLWKATLNRFIDQLKRPGRIDEFIQKLKEEDVTRTLYLDTSIQEAATHSSPPAKDDKVNLICNALIEALGKRPAEYQQNIITAHICKRPPDTNAALQLVSSLRQTSQEEADLAVAHLCFLSDSSRLYDAALGLYDLELTLLVAQNAQRDPREYMPFLQSLQALPILRRKYTIDNHLKRYALALTNLHELEAHDELEAYTIKHSLYTKAISLYTNAPTYLVNITRLHADHLSSTSQSLAAAILYESLQDYEAAYPLYALAHHWSESLTCASLVPVSATQLIDLATSLATSLTDTTRDYRAAATIHVDYLSDPRTAAALLCKGSYFAEATRLLSLPQHNLASQTPTIIDPALTQKFGEIIELIADCTTQLASQVPRIEELREKKQADPLAFYGGDAEQNGDGADIPDNISLAATDTSTLGGQSMFTRYGAGGSQGQASTKFGGTVRSDMSRKTSKTRRREERKRARGKKGSVYEEEYLIASVGRLAERVNGTHDEVRRLVLGLRRRGMRELAEKVESLMIDIAAKCVDARARVWPDSIARSKNIGENWEVNGEGRPPGADGILHDSLTGEVVNKAPEVKMWKQTL